MFNDVVPPPVMKPLPTAKMAPKIKCPPIQTSAKTPRNLEEVTLISLQRRSHR